MSLDDSRKGQLLSLKLRVLVHEHLGKSIPESDLEPLGFSRGAAVKHGTDVWVLVSDNPQRGLGPALLWALKEGAAALHVLAEENTGVLARQAEHFSFPITVWHVNDRVLLPAIAVPHVEATPALPEHLAFIDLIASGGAVPHVEHGIVTGEVLGLEVCRAVTDAYTAEVRLEVGMGAHDREAFVLLHGNKPQQEALAGVVASVAKQRHPDAEPHPFNRLAPERMLRARVVNEPGLVGAVSLEPCDPPFARSNVLDVVPCVGKAQDASGQQFIVVFTTGADPDIVPFALDARSYIDPTAELVIAMPDTHITRTNLLAVEKATKPARFLGIPAATKNSQLASPS